MATITSSSHGSHASMSGSFHSVNSLDSFTEGATSPRSPVFPTPSPVSNTDAPLPNPPFVFPARAPPSTTSGFSRANGRRPKSAHESGLNMDFKMGVPRSGPPPLPSFSFNQTPRVPEPAKSEPLSPGASLLHNMELPSRPASHIRGASELVTSDRRTGPGHMLSVSTSQGGNGPPSSGPNGGRRGHAHRRSAAISCGDLSFLVKPQVVPPMPPMPTSGSAPATPTDKTTGAAASDSIDNAVKPASGKANDNGAEQLTAVPPPRSQKTARVGFSDTIEFIPRPLSLVSSDTSSIMTIRQGHSVSNSLSSVVSVNSPSPPVKEYRIYPTADRSTKTDEYRPSTAGAVLSRTSSHESLRADDDEAAMRRNSDPPKLDDRIRSNPSFGSAGFNIRKDNTYHNSELASGFSNPLPDGYADMPRLARKASSTRSSTKKQKKVKSWAGSILSRKAKPRVKKQKVPKRSATPPMKSYHPELKRVLEVDHAPEIDLDDAYAPEPSLNIHTSTPNSPNNFINWKPRHITSSDDDSSSPIIDLDAALGPFNTPTHDQDWHAAQNSSAKAKRKMHSAAGMKNFTGPGLHYHRRAESAPALVPFDNPRFRAGNSSTMEDVFEEEEEDDWEEVKSVSQKSSTIKTEEDDTSGLGIEIKVVDAENGHGNMDWTNKQESEFGRGLKRKTSALSDMESVKAGSTSHYAPLSSPLRETFSADDFAPPPKFGDDHSLQRPLSSSRSSTSSMTPAVRPNSSREFPLMDNPPYKLTPTTPNSHTFQSPFPSPRSHLSQDTQRQSTAPSSIIDEPGFNPLWLGEPGPEIRMSTDDVPSLTSSNSTMTRESQANMSNPAQGNPQFRNGARSVSMSGPATTKKRGSIASLSRLLSSHGTEKSKLSIEERAPEGGEPRKDKGRRMSRIMQFLKPKTREPTPP